MGFLCGYAFYYLDNNNVLDVINDQYVSFFLSISPPQQTYFSALIFIMYFT